MLSTPTLNTQHSDRAVTLWTVVVHELTSAADRRIALCGVHGQGEGWVDLAAHHLKGRGGSDQIRSDQIGSHTPHGVLWVCVLCVLNLLHTRVLRDCTPGVCMI